MRMKKTMATILLTAAVSLPAVALADGPTDSSSDAARGFITDVKEARAVVLRVPINERGEENTAMVSMRLYKGDEDLSQGKDIAEAWDAGKSIDNQPSVTDDTPTDSSTWGWYRHRSYYGGWAQPYYYSSYTPYAYYYGSSYYYGSPSYYSYYSPYYGSYGYRYYYYGGCY